MLSPRLRPPMFIGKARGRQPGSLPLNPERGVRLNG